MKLSSRAYDLLQAFSSPGCPVCRLTLDSVHHYLDSLIYEYVNEVETHAMIRAARGFCPTHAWHVQDSINASAFGIAVLYDGLIRLLLREVGEVDPQGGRRQVAQAASALKPQAECPACVHQATTETHLLRNLLEHLDEPDFADAFSRSAGLCLPHLRQALDQPGSATPKAVLLHHQRAIWSRLHEHLDEFMRKHDYRFTAEEMSEDEGTSPRRAIEQMAGAKEIR